MKKKLPLTNEAGEVRELTHEDLRRFRPAAEVLLPTLRRKLWSGLRRVGLRMALRLA